MPFRRVPDDAYLKEEKAKGIKKWTFGSLREPVPSYGDAADLMPLAIKVGGMHAPAPAPSLTAKQLIKKIVGDKKDCQEGDRSKTEVKSRLRDTPVSSIPLILAK